MSDLKKYPKSLLLLVIAFSVSWSAGQAKTKPDFDENQAGSIVAVVDEKHQSLPLLRSQYDVDIDGDTATVTLVQTFLNPTEEALNATYLFPLNQKAAVFGMEMRVGNQLLKAKIKRKEDAEKTYEQAQSEGKAAALLMQHRPNMFTQNIANLMPGQPVQITLKYAQSVPKIDGAYELVIPLIVGPRYEAPVNRKFDRLDRKDAMHNLDGEKIQQPERKVQIGNWTIDQLPKYPKVIGLDTREIIDTERVTLNLNLTTATPISAFSSTTHELETTHGERGTRATFKRGVGIDNRDFVLRYAMADDTSVSAGVLSHYDERGGFISLMIEPPAQTGNSKVSPREMVFVLDTSGSMDGDPMRASKTFMREALKNLRPSDHFRILSFSDTTSNFSADPVSASHQNIKHGLGYIAGLTAHGGTEMNAAINNAFDAPLVPNTMRIIVFLTDGFIGNDRGVIRTVANRVGNARIFAFGVGTSVNRYLLEGMAAEGRGYARYVEPGESSSEVAQSFAQDLKTPLLTDITIDWNGLNAEQQFPAKVGDLFAGGSVRIFARYKRGGTHTVFINGMVNGQKARMSLSLDLPKETQAKASAIPLIWAREQIFAKNRSFTIQGESAELKEEIIKLGLDYSLQTRFTSFVAVSEKIINSNPDQAQFAQVPLPKVQHVSNNAYPNLNLSGSSTPEPHGLMGFVFALSLLMARYRKVLRGRFCIWRRKKTSKDCDGSIKNSQVPYRLAQDGWWIESKR